jgi:hypothetical protein
VGTRKRKPSKASQSKRDTLIKAARWPVVGAYVTSGWREDGSAGLLLIREHPSDGRTAAAVFFVDLWCVGVKSAEAVLDDEGLLDELESTGVPYESCAPELVAAIVDAGEAFARGLGLPQHPELPVVRELLRGLDPAKVEPVVAGQDGLPLYVPGPDDDPEQVLGVLRRTLSPEGYEALIQRMQAFEETQVPPWAFEPAPGLIERAAHDDAALDEALQRCGTIKEALVDFAVELDLEADEDVMSFDLAVLTDEILEAFLEEATGLDEAERALVRSWSDPVVGVFRVLERDADRLRLEDYVDDLHYTVRSNMGLGSMTQLPEFEFVLTTLVPGPRDWLLSGDGTMLPDEEAALEAAWQIVNHLPRQVHRNPDLARRARELQLVEHERFVAHFGSDEVIVEGSALQAAVDGWAVPPMDVSHLEEFDSVGLLSDPVEGLLMVPEYGAFRASFADPQRADLEVVEGYLQTESVGPQTFLRMARDFPEGVDEVLGEVTGRPDFRWERDGAALLREYKGSWRVLPSVTVVPERLAEWMKRRGEG